MTDKAKEGRNTTQILAQIDAEIARLEQAGSLPVVRNHKHKRRFSLLGWCYKRALRKANARRSASRSLSRLKII
jgi:hypothetical protein